MCIVSVMLLMWGSMSFLTRVTGGGGRVGLLFAWFFGCVGCILCLLCVVGCVWVVCVVCVVCVLCVLGVVCVVCLVCVVCVVCVVCAVCLLTVLCVVPVPLALPSQPYGRVHPSHPFLTALPSAYTADSLPRA